MKDDLSEAWFEQLQRGEDPALKPWQRVDLLEYVARRHGDAPEVAEQLIGGPIPGWRLDEMLTLAATHGNEQVALRLLGAGASSRPIMEACGAGLAELATALVERGARINRKFSRDLAPIHVAAASPNATATTAALVRADCDLTARTPSGQWAWELADAALAEQLRSGVGQHGPQWFREAQLQDIDHYVFVRDDAMFGFNPNDVQYPIWTGNEDEGFGWPNSIPQAREVLAGNRVLASELEWFLPFLDLLEAGDDFSLSDLGARVPRRREPSWR